MAMNITSRLISFRSILFPKRWLSTATARATETPVTKGHEEGDSLYPRLSALKSTNGDVSETIDEWVKAGNSVKKVDLIRVVNEYRKLNKYHHALQVYEQMKKVNVKLTNEDHKRIIDLLAYTKGIDSAETYFNSLQEFAKTQKTYSGLLYCCCKENMLEKATNLFETMKNLNFFCSLMYNSMMSLYLKIGQPEKVTLLAEEMEEKNVVADVYTYNHLMNAYAAANDFQAVEKIIEKMEKSGAKQDWTTYKNMATIFADAGLIDKANDALEKLEKLENSRDREIFHTLITLYSRVKNLPGVNRAWDSLKLVHPNPSNRSYLVMLHAMGNLGDFNGVNKYYKEWESNDSLGDVRVSNFMLASYLDRDMIEEANLLLKKVAEKGVEPNLRTLDLFIKFHLKNRDIDLGLQYLEKGVSKAIGKDKNWFPNEEIINIFLKFFEEEADVDGAEKFCKIMKTNNPLTGKIYKSLLNTYIAAEKMEQQMRKRMMEDNVDIDSDTENLLQRVCSE